MAETSVIYSAEALTTAETSFAPLELFNGGTNVHVYARPFDRATREYANGSFVVPTDLDTGGTVTFRLYWIARVVPGSSEDVIWAFEHSARNGDEDYDAAYTEKKATASGTGTVQDNLIEKTWTETVSNLAWAVNDLVFFRVSRDSADGNDTFDNNGTPTNDDALLFAFAIEIPVA